VAEPRTYTQEEFEAAVSGERDALKAKRDEALDEAKKAKAKLQQYDGVDPEEYKTLKTKAAEAERNRLTAEGNFKELEKQITDRAASEKQQLLDRHKSELDGRDVQIRKLTGALERRGIKGNLTTELTKQGAKPQFIDLLVNEGSKSVRLREAGDDYEEYVSDEKGNQRIADGKGTPMTIAQLVEQDLKARFSDAFEGTGSSGGGAPKPVASGGGGGKPKVIPAGDQKAFIDNVKEIASGKAEVST
jgi:hypothetical protein